jgi:hypothetical protein
MPQQEGSDTMKRAFVILALAGLVSLGIGCRFHGGLYVPVAPIAYTAANVAVTAAIVGTAIALTTPHDAHVHWESCGCPRQWHEGRWVYYYGGSWEYHDPGTGYWYHY